MFPAQLTDSSARSEIKILGRPDQNNLLNECFVSSSLLVSYVCALALPSGSRSGDFE